MKPNEQEIVTDDFEEACKKDGIEIRHDFFTHEAPAPEPEPEPEVEEPTE